MAAHRGQEGGWPAPHSAAFGVAVEQIAAAVRELAEQLGYGLLWRRHGWSVQAQIDAELTAWLDRGVGPR
ncbi:MAG: hypothetical protein IT204_07125 [Fimbriimonadaceae bacterium]|nr:hypothetical protein [Fimbriimonadaceae bacterium]